MIIGFTPYAIETKNGTSNNIPDLKHLEESLRKEGYTIQPSLDHLGDDKYSLASIRDLNGNNGSFIRKNKLAGDFELLVCLGDTKLNKFAKNYTPVPSKK